jgi:2-alkyl-3-oxoalkanoate reductase
MTKEAHGLSGIGNLDSPNVSSRPVPDVYHAREGCMKVMVAGASGVIGRALIPALVRAGHSVTALTRSETKSKALQNAGAAAMVGDVFNEVVMRRIVLSASPQVFIHELTSLPSEGNLKHFDETFAATNRLRTIGTHLLLKISLEAGVSRFIAQSFAGWPYERTGGPVKREDDPLDPNPPKNARQSLTAIRYLEDKTLRTQGIQGIVLRYGLLYGPGTAIATDGFLVREVKKRRMPIVGAGAGVWSFIHVEDAASATVAAVERGRTGIYNIVDDEPAAVSEWLPELANAVGAKPPRRIPALFARFAIGEQGVSMMTQARGAANQKAKQELGWSPKWKSWREGFRHAL